MFFEFHRVLWNRYFFSSQIPENSSPFRVSKVEYPLKNIRKQLNTEKTRDITLLSARMRKSGRRIDDRGTVIRATIGIRPLSEVSKRRNLGVESILGTGIRVYDEIRW